MKLNFKYLQKCAEIGNMRILTAVLVMLLLLIPSNTFGVINLWDAPQGMPDIDNRVGSVLPTAAQLSRVSSLGARADWNRFGTINTLVKDGGFISTGLSGEPVEAAREWIRLNSNLFRLSEQSVANLQLVNDAKMPYNDAHFVLFRQKFGSYAPTQDGQISVSIVNGNVFHVWSSSAGDQSLVGQALLSPVQAWLAAATNVNLGVPLSSITGSNIDANNNWTMIDVTGFVQQQQARLTAMPSPNGIARLAYEVNVINVHGHISNAYTVFVDAQLGSILYRVNRVYHLMPPETNTFQGEYQPQAYPCGGTTHNFTVPTGKVRIAVQATAAIATNDLKVHLLYNGNVVAEEDTGTSSEALNYAPAGGVPAGAYSVKICQTPNTMGVPQTAPFSYVGTFTTDDTNAPGVANSPRWKYHAAYPDLDFLNTDLRRMIGCWQITPGGTVPVGCNRDERNVAARAPWDFDFNAGATTNTTRGNAAQTAESWGSPLTPSTPYAPVSATRDYSFRWTNHWNRTKCDPSILLHTGSSGANAQDDADIDAAIVQLFVTHNRFHDWSYNLGFTESNYNLQLENFGNTDATRENDPEIGNVQAGAVSGGAAGMYLGRDNANQIALQDGTPGITNQYLFQPIGAAFYAPCTDGDNDVGIVGHEYTHAISGRMVGGPDAGLTGAQAGSMNESWSDLDAAEYENAFNYVPQQGENKTAVGIYATNNRKLAIRDYNLEENPLNYSNIGFDTPGPEVHSDGEIWNAVNWNIRQVLIDKYNSQYPYSDIAARRLCAEGKKNPADCAGNRRWIQMIFDAYLLQPGATSMLNARDAYLASDVARYGGANQTELWRVFGQRGFGVLANSNGTEDTAPIPDFSSPLENNATVTFNVLAKDESNTAVTNAKIFVGDYEVRSRPIADTDPATVVSTTDPRSNINDNVAKFVPGTYSFVVQAPGYGSHKFSQTFAAGATPTITFSLPTNRASLTKGATVTTTATDTNDIASKSSLIDDTEGSGARLGTTLPVTNYSLTVDLQGTAAVNVTSVNVSTAAGPTNGGRFTGVRKFAIDACTVSVVNLCTLDANFTTVYTSPDDAFPAEVPRPVQPQLTMRSFDIPDTMATQLRLRVLTTQCTGKAEFLGEQDNDPLNNTDCASLMPLPNTGPTTNPNPNLMPLRPGFVARATEFQAFTSAPSIVVPAGVECDVFPRGTGDGFVDSLDVGQVTRFQLGLDSYMPGEFQRADCSLGTGDGYVDSLDVGQAQRYQTGLDPAQAAAGPAAPFGRTGESEVSDQADGNQPPSNESAAVSREIEKSSRQINSGSGTVRVVNGNAAAGRTVTVSLETDATGEESIYGFSLNYNPAVLTYVPGSAVIGADAVRQEGGTCSLLENGSVAGRIGFSIDCSNSAMTVGSRRRLVTVQFTVAAGARVGRTALTFGDLPTKRVVSSNPSAGAIKSVMTNFSDGFLNITKAGSVPGKTLSFFDGERNYEQGSRLLASQWLTTDYSNKFVGLLSFQ